MSDIASGEHTRLRTEDTLDNSRRVAETASEVLELVNRAVNILYGEEFPIKDEPSVPEPCKIAIEPNGVVAQIEVALERTAKHLKAICNSIGRL